MYTTDRTTHRAQRAASRTRRVCGVCTRRERRRATWHVRRLRREVPGRRRRHCRPVRAPDAVAESETVDRPTHVQTRGLADWRTTRLNITPQNRGGAARAPRVSRGLAYNYTRTRFSRYPANITKATCRGRFLSCKNSYPYKCCNVISRPRRAGRRRSLHSATSPRARVLLYFTVHT